MSWFDRFGIQRLAVDRGLLEESDKLEGTFVVFLDGDSGLIRVERQVPTGGRRLWNMQK